MQSSVVYNIEPLLPSFIFVNIDLNSSYSDCNKDSFVENICRRSNTWKLNEMEISRFGVDIIATIDIHVMHMVKRKEKSLKCPAWSTLIPLREE